MHPEAVTAGGLCLGCAGGSNVACPSCGGLGVVEAGGRFLTTCRPCHGDGIRPELPTPHATPAFVSANGEVLLIEREPAS